MHSARSRGRYKWWGLLAASAAVMATVAVLIVSTGRPVIPPHKVSPTGARAYLAADVPVGPGLWVNSRRLWEELSVSQRSDLIARLDKLTPTFDAKARTFQPRAEGLRARLVPPAKTASLRKPEARQPAPGQPVLAAAVSYRSPADDPSANFPSSRDELWSAGTSVSTDQPCVTETGSVFRSLADVLSLCEGWGAGVVGPNVPGYTTSGLSTAVVVGGGDELASAYTGLSAAYTVPTNAGPGQTVNATVTVTSLQVVAGWQGFGAACAPAEVTENDPGTTDGATAYGEPGGINVSNITSCWSSLAFGAVFEPAVQAANTAYGALTAGVSLVQSAVGLPGWPNEPCAEIGFAASYANYVKGVSDLVGDGNGPLATGPSVSLRELGVNNNLTCSTNTYQWCSPDVPPGTRVDFSAAPTSAISSEGLSFVADMLVDWTSVDVTDNPCPGQAPATILPPGTSMTSTLSGTLNDETFVPPGNIPGDSLTISVPGSAPSGTFSGVFSVSQFATGAVIASGDIQGELSQQGLLTHVIFSGNSGSGPPVRISFSGSLQPLGLGLVGTLNINGKSEPASFISDG